MESRKKHSNNRRFKMEDKCGGPGMGMDMMKKMGEDMGGMPPMMEK